MLCFLIVCAMLFCLILLLDLSLFLADAGRWLAAPFYLYWAPSLTFFLYIFFFYFNSYFIFFFLDITSGDP